MDELTLLPRPRLLVTEQGSGPRFTTPLREASSAIGLALGDDPADAVQRFGVRIEACTIEAFSTRTSLRVPDGFVPAEGYALRIDGKGALVGADTRQGRFYAAQTLAQLLCGSGEGALPRLHCFDWPLMRLRGFTFCYHIVGDTLPLLAPNYEAALQWIGVLSHFKMNALLLELETMFPYRRHPAIPSGIAFTPAQIEGLRAACERSGVQVIPLVQSIGHAYAVLRHPEYAHLRELPDTSQQYCLCNDAVPRFYAELADEVIDAFGASRLHIGGDESRRLGQCPDCREKASRVGIGGLYADHVNRVAAHLLQRGVTPVVWGDIMEDHPDILDRIDPRIEIIYWNYDMVDWNRPYVLETYVRADRTVYTGSAARFGSHGDATFLYQKAMRNIGLLSQETTRNKLAGMLVTDWPKLAPYEVGMVATSYGAEAAWSVAGEQEEFCARWAAILFGARMSKLDLFYRLVSEITLKRKEIMNPHWAPPFVDQTVHFMPDWLDRLDWSAWSFSHVLAQYTQQELVPKAMEQMRLGLTRAEEALRLADEYAPTAVYNRRLFDAIRLAALNQKVKCAMGLALTRAAQLLKFPRPDDLSLRRATADGLRSAARGWEDLREETLRVLRPGTFPESLECALRCKLDPAAARHMARFIELLEAGKAVHGLLDGTTW